MPTSLIYPVDVSVMIDATTKAVVIKVKDGFWSWVIDLFKNMKNNPKPNKALPYSKNKQPALRKQPYRPGKSITPEDLLPPTEQR